MDDKQRAAKAVEILKTVYPEATCALQWGGQDGWKLLVMGRLSAQCKDSTVNEVCVGLFEAYPTLETLAEAPVEHIEEIIHKCGLFRSKAKDIKNACRMLIDEFDGVVPDEMEALLRIPGVGRKIANLLLGDLYHKAGIVADTHCMRICGRLGFYEEGKKDPVKTERIMSKLVEPAEQSDFCHRIVQFGRDVCDSRVPRCGDCPLGEICKGRRTK